MTSLPVVTSDLDAAAFLVANGHPLRGVEKQTTGFTAFKFDPDAAAVLASFYSGGLVSGQAMGAALRQLKKAIHSYEDKSYATRHNR